LPCIGNCYGEDSDSDNKYYSYYGKDNHQKPQPNPTPPEGPEPNYHETDHEDKTEVDWETNNRTYENNEEYKDGEIEGAEADEGCEPEYEGDEEEELEELGPKDEEDKVLGTNEEATKYKHRELENGENGLFKHTGRGPRTQGDEHEPHQPTHELKPGNRGTHELRELKCETQEPHQPESKPEHDGDDEANGYAYTDHHPPYTMIVTPTRQPCPTPRCTPRTRPRTPNPAPPAPYPHPPRGRRHPFRINEVM
jgi:hypothetical protein